MQATGGSVVSISNADGVVFALHTSPVSYAGGPFFSTSVFVSTYLSDDPDRYGLRVRHGDWTSNLVRFDYPVRRESPY